jgi:hypothetical protein
MRRFATLSPEPVRKALRRNSTDNFVIFDSPAEIAAYMAAKPDKPSMMTLDQPEFFGNDGWQSTTRKAREGDLDCVEASDALMSRFERFAFETGRSAWLDDVTGAIPNVPAFIAGHPLAMRRRIRQDSDDAPIALFVDLGSSSMVTAEKIQRRGAAILALVRILSTRRPLELWIGDTSGTGDKNCIAVMCRIETAPLDIATAAFTLTNPAFCRRLFYGLAQQEYGWEGGWPYTSQEVARAHLPEIIAPALSHVGQILCIKGIHANDDSVNDPEKWIEQRLAELSPVCLAA